MQYIRARIGESFATPGSWIETSSIRINDENKLVYSADGKVRYDEGNSLKLPWYRSSSAMYTDIRSCGIGKTSRVNRSLALSVPIVTLIPPKIEVKAGNAQNFSVMVSCAQPACVSITVTEDLLCTFKRTKGRYEEEYQVPRTESVSGQIDFFMIYMGHDTVLAQKVANAFEHLFTKSHGEYKKGNKNDPF